MQSGRDRPAVDSTLHILYIPKLLFRRDQHNKTLVLYAFPPVSSRRWLGAKSKFVCFVMLSWTLARASMRHCRTLRAQADSFNACNQLWNADRLENLSTDMTFYTNNSS